MIERLETLLENAEVVTSANPIPKSSFKTVKFCAAINLRTPAPTFHYYDGPISRNNVYDNLRYYLIFGRILGVLPLVGVFRSDVKYLQFKVVSLAVAVSVLTSVLLFACTVVPAVGMFRKAKTNATELAYSANQTTFFLFGFFVYTFFLRKSNEFLALLKDWDLMCLHFTRKDKHINRYFILTTTIIFSSAVLENASYHVQLFPVFEYPEARQNKSRLEVYYIEEYNSWTNILPFNPVLTILLFFANKFCLYAWNYGDILIALLCRMLHFRFTALYEIAEERINQRNNSMDFYFWAHLTQDHNSLVDLVRKLSVFLSPLVFASYSINIYNTCLLVFLALTPKGHQTWANSIYSFWAFIQITGRVFVFTLAAARLNDYATDIRNLYAKCPNERYTTEIKKAEKKLSTGGFIGLDGWGCFNIKKSFLLHIISVIFTIELVLLQAPTIEN